MVLRSAASIPVYTTILGQATSACGSLYAAASVDGIIAVWRTSSLSSGKPIVRLKTDGNIYSLLTAGSYLLVGGRDRVRAWAWASLGEGQSQHEPSWELPLQGRGEVNTMALLSEAGTDGRLVLGTGDNNVYLVDLETRVIVRAMSGHVGYIHSVDTCGDSVIASGGEDGCVKLWDTSQQEAVHSVRPAEDTDLARPGCGSHVSSVAVTGDWLVAGGGPAPAIWHLKSLALATSLPCGDSEVKVVRFQEDTVMVAGRGRKLYQATISGELKSEVEMSSSVIYSIEQKRDPNLMCCAGSSSYIDILTNQYNYKDDTIEFPVLD